MIRDGDELKTTCIFNSETRTRTTNFGDATSDEMCLAFFTYYPKENLRSGSKLIENYTVYKSVRNAL